MIYCKLFDTIGVKWKFITSLQLLTLDMQLSKLWQIPQILQNFYPVHSQVEFPQIGHSLETSDFLDTIILQEQMRQIL